MEVNMKEDRRIVKANQLRKKAILADRESQKAVNEWCKAKEGTKQYNNARRKSNRLETKANKAYDDYYYYVHKNFEKENIDRSMHRVIKNKKNNGKFLSRAFLNGLKQ